MCFKRFNDLTGMIGTIVKLLSKIKMCKVNVFEAFFAEHNVYRKNKHIAR